jgi:hypothetical protein
MDWGQHRAISFFMHASEKEMLYPQLSALFIIPKIQGQKIKKNDLLQIKFSHATTRTLT